MSLCLNPACNKANPDGTKFCQSCRTVLLILDRYRAVKQIGQGGFGKTFLAQDEAKPSKPKCVIKQFIYNDPASLQEAQRLFEQEAVRLDDLGKHPQIPELLAHTIQQGQQYLVQEFIDGSNLQQELKQSERFSETKIKELLLDLLPVLQFIHKGNIIHRDIKPENIIRRRSDGKLVLVDFGAAKVATHTALARTGTTIGSPEYAAPEQGRGKAVFASDIYGLGVTCIHLLTYIPPFDLFSDLEDKWIWREFLNENAVNHDLGVVLDKMLEKALSRRFQTASDVLQALQPKSQPATNPTPMAKAQPAPPPPSTKTGLFSGLFSSPPTQSAKSASSSLVLDCGKGVKLELVSIPSGSFNMGSNDYGDEKPIHSVKLSAFKIGKYPITQKQYQAVIGNNPSYFKGDENCPVERVSWHEAVAFCDKLSTLTGRTVNLPSEAQWEYACRAGSTTKYYFGDNSNQLRDYAWYSENAEGKTHPVGDKLPNNWELYDMHGNVWEWCEDVWHDNYNSAPNDGTAWLKGGEQSRRVLRGGSWDNIDYFCRSADRNRFVVDDGYD
jgi:formylglycine-generating enzyme required for sulfatase activity